MTVLALGTDIPSAINSAERLFSWSAFLLHDLNRGLYYKETNEVDGSVPVMTAGLVEAADGSDRLIVRAAIPFSTAWRYEKTSKIWMHAEDIRDVVIPATFKAN